MTVIITDCDHGNIDEEMKVFDAVGIPLRLEQCKTEDDLIGRCADGEWLVNQYTPVTRRVMTALPNLKFVVRYGVGVDNIDVAAATELGIQVCNVPDYGMNEVADHALTFFLALNRKLVPMNEQTKKKKWDHRTAIPVRRMSETTVGLYGLGRIGKNFAAKAHALGCRIIGYDVNGGVFADPAIAFVEKVGFDELLAHADTVLIFAPLETTRGAFDKAVLAKMKPSAYLINTSRGGIVNETDLDQALKNGVIAGAAFDVMAKEPADPANPLFQNENFICTPHMAWYSEESALELKRKAAEEAVSYALHRTCRYPVNQPTARR
ncbi:MAG: C-terminal binding protein [Peptococcaceae bacterium]|jgi:D-3-phosphoglycerate dehydrogenase|nr:C-terminal binding protein [Peptococcaceae bacterium]